jgi:hypothetical protein
MQGCGHGAGKQRHYYTTPHARDARRIVVALLACAMLDHIKLFLFLTLQQPW